MNSQFQIEEKNENTLFHQVNIKNKITGEFISILPALGARLNAAHLNSNEKLIAVLSELKSPDIKTNDELFNNAILFPFAGRIRKGYYTFQNQSYQLPLNYSHEGNACHGFLYDKKFVMVSKNISEEFAEVELSYYSSKINDGYPFLFNVAVVYRLSGNGQVTILTKVENQSRSEMLFSYGLHPYYTLGNSVDDLVLEFNAKEKIELDKFNVPSGARIQSNNGKPTQINLSEKELDDVFKLTSESGRNEIYLISKKTEVVLRIWQESGVNKYNYLVLYIPPHRKSIAIEPMTSCIDSFNNKEGLVIIEPEETWSASLGFSLTNL